MTACCVVTVNTPDLPFDQALERARSRLRRALMVMPVTWGNEPAATVSGCRGARYAPDINTATALLIPTV